MKSLSITLLIIGAAFLGYDYFLAPPWERLVFEKGAAPLKVNTSTPAQPPGVPETPPPPAMTAAAETDYVPTVPALPSREFVPPQLATLEDLTKNWTTVPTHAFPRPVKLRKAVDVKMAAGSARIPEGATAYAYSAEKGWVTVGPTETSKARGMVALADTDLQEQLRQSYEKWKTARV
ncbi:MAG TPA: hypothetical protein VD994_02525, partial [Prosthecobacter sp.]|nr:hypothetical protein [Prosthecobacter sp.]